MSLEITLAATAVLAAISAFAGWRGARPPNFHKGPRLMPWRLIMLVAAASLLMVVVHLVNLLGVTTGQGR